MRVNRHGDNYIAHGMGPRRPIIIESDSRLDAMTAYFRQVRIQKRELEDIEYQKEQCYQAKADMADGVYAIQE